MPQLSALVVDDEAPALSEPAFLLGRDERIGVVLTAGGGAEALRLLESNQVDVVFCDIKMPGLDGLDLARVLARFSRRRATGRGRPSGGRGIRCRWRCGANHRRRDDRGRAGWGRSGQRCHDPRGGDGSTRNQLSRGHPIHVGMAGA